ncbi:MAG: pyridoxamine 5'-phosphate oxidase family protein [Tannerella sp.]|jgi:nitroimidazol reductase NimA-like FMN-containing flavoprotein (pyridoxamine 5'-phosphate oxidase superfamily)|nr:pyridoxamine 5'-phosphate oxidase family protein [Tannerella sp.]
MKTVIHTEPEHIADVISRCDICFVGMSQSDGTPYVLPMNFGYSDGTVWLHSAFEGTHIDILKSNPKVCIVFNTANRLVWQHQDVACSYRMQAETVIGWGNVVFEEDYDTKVEALNVLMRHYTDKTFTYSKPSVVNTCIWRVRLERVSCRAFGVPHKQAAL